MNNVINYDAAASSPDTERRQGLKRKVDEIFRKLGRFATHFGKKHERLQRREASVKGLDQWLKSRSQWIGLGIAAIPCALILDMFLHAPFSIYMGSFVSLSPQASQWVIPFLIVTLELLLNWLKAEVHARVKRRTLDGIDGQSDWLSYRFVVAVAVLVLCLATQLTLLTMLVREAAVLRTTEVLSLEWLSSLGMVLTVTGITFVTHFIILFGKHHVYHSWAYAFMRLHRAFTSWRLRKAKVNLRKARQAFSDRYGEFEDATSRLHAVYPNEPLQEYHMTVEMRKAYDACFKGTTSDATTDRSPDATPHASPDIDGRAGEQNLRRRVVHRR